MGQYCLPIVGLLILSTFTAWGAANDGEASIFPLLDNRTQHDVDFEAGVCLFVAGATLYAHDLESGVRRWTIPVRDILRITGVLDETASP